VPAPAAAFVSATLLDMTTGQFSYALKSKLQGGLCLIIIGTEGNALRLCIAPGFVEGLGHWDAEIGMAKVEAIFRYLMPELVIAKKRSSCPAGRGKL
jgi:hypothetical protein